MTYVGPLRVLYSFPHRVGAAGIGTTALNQVRGLADLGANVTLACTSLHSDVPSSVQVVETLRVGGRRIPHRTFGSPEHALAYHDYRVSRIVRSASFGRFDIVHTWPQSALATIRAARTVGCLSSREVPNTHTANAYEEALIESKITGVELARSHSHRPNRRRIALENLEYQEADMLLVPSDHVAQTFAERGIPAGRLRRHQYGYDDSRFQAAERIEWPVRPFRALFVGSGEPRKGLHYALEAWARCEMPKGAEFVIAGEFVPGYRAYISDLLSTPSVTHVGFVGDVPVLMRRSDVLLLPSVEEGSALVTYEAQASGCIPLVSSAAGALLPPVLREYVHAPRDIAALSEHLNVMANDPLLRATLRQAVIEWSSALTWQSAAQRMLEIYYDAIEKMVAPTFPDLGKQAPPAT